MAKNYDYFSNKGTTRYHIDYGSTTAATSTGFVWSATSCYGAQYHAYQVKVIAPDTSTASLTFVLQGSLDVGTATNWFNLEGSTMGISGTGTIKYVALTDPTPISSIKPVVTALGTSASQEVGIWIMGNAAGMGF